MESLRDKYGFKYDTVVGGLIHLLQVRHDLDLGIRQLARFSMMPGEKAYKYALHFCGYIQDTRNAYMCFEGPGRREGEKLARNGRNSIKILAASNPLEIPTEVVIRCNDSAGKDVDLEDETLDGFRGEGDQNGEKGGDRNEGTDRKVGSINEVETLDGLRGEGDRNGASRSLRERKRRLQQN